MRGGAPRRKFWAFKHAISLTFSRLTGALLARQCPISVLAHRVATAKAAAIAAIAAAIAANAANAVAVAAIAVAIAVAGRFKSLREVRDEKCERGAGRLKTVTPPATAVQSAVGTEVRASCSA